MKRIDFRIPVIIVLTVILIIMNYFYFKSDDPNTYMNRNSGTKNQTSETSTLTIQATAEIQSALNENLELHATYYLKKCYVSVNQLVKEGEAILKYKNGKYLKAPYDLIITSINIPDVGGQCTQNHALGVSANNVLEVQFYVDETKINSVSLGDLATVKISALDDQEYEGIVTHVSHTASDGAFTVTVEFENDGNIYIGMTASVTIQK